MPIWEGIVSRPEEHIGIHIFFSAVELYFTLSLCVSGSIPLHLQLNLPTVHYNVFRDFPYSPQRNLGLTGLSPTIGGPLDSTSSFLKSETSTQAQPSHETPYRDPGNSMPLVSVGSMPVCEVPGEAKPEEKPSIQSILQIHGKTIAAINDPQQ